MWHAATMSDVATSGVEDPATAAGVAFARGAGYGALFGGIFGLFIAPVTELVTFTDDRFDPGTLLLGVFTAPVGAFYGLIAGISVAAAFSLLPRHRRTRTTARWTAVIVGPAIVSLIGWWLFRPSLTVGANQTRDHVVETLMIAYIYPGVTSLGVALTAGHRLVAPVRGDDTPSWADSPTP